MRVLYVHHGARRGGAPSSLLTLLRGFAPGRVEPVVYLPPGEVADDFERQGIEVVRGPVSQFAHLRGARYAGARWGILLVREGPLLLPHLRRLDEAIRRVRPDIVHLNESSLVPAFGLARRRGVPVVWSLRSTLHPAGRIRRRVLRAAVARASAAIAIDADVAASWGHPPNAVAIFNGVDLHDLRPGTDPEMRERLAPGFGGVLVGMLNQLYPEKGIYDLLEALTAVAHRRPDLDVAVAFIGAPTRPSGWYATPHARAMTRLGLVRDHRLELERRAAESGCRVFFPGYEPDVARAYRALDVVAFPSHLEAVGRPALEAAACAVPVVATSSAHASAIVEHEVTGLLVPPRRPDALAAALERLSSDAALRRRLGEEAARRSHRFDHRRQAARVLEVYEGVLERRRAAAA